jgi:hypothetical protein
VPEENITESFLMLCSLVDQAPNDVIDSAVEADPHKEPVSVVWKSSSISRARYNIFDFYSEY